MLMVGMDWRTEGLIENHFPLDALHHTWTKLYPVSTDNKSIVRQDHVHKDLVQEVGAILASETRFQFRDTETPNGLAKFLLLNDDAEPKTFLPVTG